LLVIQQGANRQDVGQRIPFALLIRETHCRQCRFGVYHAIRFVRHRTPQAHAIRAVARATVGQFRAQGCVQIFDHLDLRVAEVKFPGEERDILQAINGLSGPSTGCASRDTICNGTCQHGSNQRDDPFVAHRVPPVTIVRYEPASVCECSNGSSAKRPA
jgi:hypothetical protein